MISIPLYKYQKRAVGFLSHREGKAGLYMEMGTGKSRVALAYAYMRAQRILIVCPLSVVSVWKNEIKKLGLDYKILDISTGPLRERTKRLNRANRATFPFVVLCNYESYWREPLRRAIMRSPFQAIIMDEAHRLKNRTAKQSRFAHTFADREDAQIRLALTGTPITQGIQDLFSIYRFIDPSVFGDDWSAFEQRYLQMGGFYGFQVVGYKNVEEVHAKVAATAFQISKSEALDLPERTDVVIPVPLSHTSRLQYNAMRDKALADIEGVDEDGKPIRGIALARIVLTTLLRLQQITDGFVRIEAAVDKSRPASTVDISSEKLDIACDLVHDAVEQGQKVVIFCRFVHDLRRLWHRLPGSVVIAGSVPSEQRQTAIDALNSGKTSVLLAQIQTGSLGIDLTAASVGIFYSSGFSLGDFLQSRDRLHRHGQTRKVTNYHLLGEDTVDEKIYEALSSKQSIAKMVTGNKALQLEAINDALNLFGLVGTK